MGRERDNPTGAAPPPPVALTIAGSDSSGGAGIQADLKTFTLLGCYGASALTAVTAQNTDGVQAAVHLEPDLVERQLASVACDLPVAATKTGMLGSAAVIAAVAEAVRRHELFPLVVDPVMVAKSGDALIDADAVAMLRDRLLPLATVVTPNRHEAARLCGFDVDTLGEASRAAELICDAFGARACVVKAIRSAEAGRPVVIDVFCDGERVPRLSTRGATAGTRTARAAPTRRRSPRASRWGTTSPPRSTSPAGASTTPSPATPAGATASAPSTTWRSRASAAARDRDLT